MLVMMLLEVLCSSRVCTGAGAVPPVHTGKEVVLCVLPMAAAQPMFPCVLTCGSPRAFVVAPPP
jgi:hypothetical protein